MFLRKKRGKLKLDESSIVLNIIPVLEARNISKPHAFLMKIGINNKMATKILSGNAIQLNFQQMTKICFHLNCTPNDLLATRKMELPPHHALTALKKLDEQLPSIEEWLKGKTLAEIKEILKS